MKLKKKQQKNNLNKQEHRKGIIFIAKVVGSKKRPYNQQHKTTSVPSETEGSH